MLELLICENIRKGYKVVIPKNQKIIISSKYRTSVYTSPSQVRPQDKLKFVGWATANNEDRQLWMAYL